MTADIHLEPGSSRMVPVPNASASPSRVPEGVLPPRDQKAYDLGARSAREVIDELRREIDVLQGERDAQIDRADRMDAELGVVRDQLREATDIGRSSRNAEVCRLLDVIRNQNTQMAWQQEQLDLAGARERAYVDAINELVREVTETHAKARRVLEGPS